MVKNNRILKIKLINYQYMNNCNKLLMDKLKDFVKIKFYHIINNNLQFNKKLQI